MPFHPVKVFLKVFFNFIHSLLSILWINSQPSHEDKSFHYAREAHFPSFVEGVQLNKQTNGMQFSSLYGCAGVGVHAL